MPLLYRRRHRLTHAAEYQAVYAARVSKRAGPFLIFTLPNNRPCHRLGLSVGRKVGKAVDRNTVKRRIREAFRLLQDDLPGRYDIVVNVRPHDPLTLDDHKRLLAMAVNAAHQVWSRRSRT